MGSRAFVQVRLTHLPNFLTTMSTYTNYESSASTEYDLSRIPTGVEKVEALIKKHSKTEFSKINLLGLASGTGTYERVLLDNGIGRITFTEGAQSMLDQSEEKMKDLAGSRKAFKHITLPNVPYTDEFDVCFNNQVFHHLPITDKQTGKVTDWSPVIDSFKNVNKSLKKDGIFIVGQSTPDQNNNYWFSHLVPKCKEHVQHKFISKDQMRDFAEKAGFEMVEIELLDTPQWVGYNDPVSFVKEERFWFCDSTLSGEVGQPEIPAAKELVKKMLADGTLEAWVKEKDGFPEFGLSYFYVMRKI